MRTSVVQAMVAILVAVSLSACAIDGTVTPTDVRTGPAAYADGSASPSASTVGSESIRPAASYDGLGATTARWIANPSEIPIEAMFWDLAAGGDRLVAVGQRMQIGTYPFPSAWSSSDGLSWTESELLSEEAGQVSDVAWSRELGYVAIGSDRDGQHIWHSMDGTTWVQVDAVAALDPWADGGPVVSGEFCCGVGLRDVAAGPDGFVAVGGAGDAKTSARAAILTSPDGRSWSRVAFSDALTGGIMTELLHVPSVGWMANGAYAWTSPDGTNWSRGDRFERSPLSLVVHGDEASAAASWGGALNSTQTGLEWSRAAPELAEREDLYIRRLVSTDEGVIAVGERRGSGRPQVILWLSRDGVRWTNELVLDDAHVMAPPILSDGLIVLYGWIDGFVARSWAVPLEDLTSAPPPAAKVH